LSALVFTLLVRAIIARILMNGAGIRIADRGSVDEWRLLSGLIDGFNNEFKNEFNKKAGLNPAFLDNF
jgi:hypothetical protein